MHAWTPLARAAWLVFVLLSGACAQGVRPGGALASPERASDSARVRFSPAPPHGWAQSAAQPPALAGTENAPDTVAAATGPAERPLATVLAPPSHSPTASPDPGSTPAEVYSSLSPDACLAELVRRGVGFVRLAEHDGVETPVRLAGPLHGVRVHAPGIAPVHEVLDCRLALALDDLTTLLARRGVVQVLHMSLYRPGARIAGSGKPSQHGAGLAVDVGTLVLADGRRISVAKSFPRELGAPVSCDAPPSPGAEPRPEPLPGTAAAEADDRARFLTETICEVAAAGLFNLILTPNYNQAHHDHFHLDLVPGKRYFDMK